VQSSFQSSRFGTSHFTASVTFCRYPLLYFEGSSVPILYLYRLLAHISTSEYSTPTSIPIRLQVTKVYFICWNWHAHVLRDNFYFRSWKECVFIFYFMLHNKPFLGINNQYFLVRFKIYSVATFSRCYKFANMIICLNCQNCILVSLWKNPWRWGQSLVRPNFGFHDDQRVKWAQSSHIILYHIGTYSCRRRIITVYRSSQLAGQRWRWTTLLLVHVWKQLPLYLMVARLNIYCRLTIETLKIC